MKKPATKPLVSSTKCPHCNTTCKTYKTEQLSPTVRQVIYTCQNKECGTIFEAQIVPTRTLVQSLQPNPDVFIPHLQ